MRFAGDQQGHRFRDATALLAIEFSFTDEARATIIPFFLSEYS